MRIVAYFVGWLLAMPGICVAALFIAVGHAIALGNLAAIAWAALLAFIYGVPLVGLVALVIVILGFFRMGRVIGAGTLLVAAIGAIAVILESSGAPQHAGEFLFLAPTAAAAALAGWLLYSETRTRTAPPILAAPP